MHKAKVTTKPRVLFLAPHPFVVERGSSFRTLATVSALHDLGYQIDLVTFGFGTSPRLDSLTIYRTPRIPFISRVPVGFSFRKILHDIFLLFIAFYLCLCKRYVVIHSVEESLFAGMFLSSLFKTPYFIDSYSDISGHIQKLSSSGENIFKRYAGSLLRKGATKASGIISSGASFPRFRKDQAYCNIRSLPLTSFVRPDEGIVRKTAEKFQLTRKRVILFCGNLDKNDGVELVLRAFASILRSQTLSEPERVGLCLVIAGGGSSVNERVVRYRKLALHLGIEHRTVFTGRSPGEDFSSLVTLANCVICSKTEGTKPSLKLFSYLGAGTPIVATKIPSHTEIIDNEIAILTDTTVESLADGLLQTLLLDESHLRAIRRKTEKGEKKVSEIFKEHQFKNRLAELYSTIPTPKNPSVEKRSQVTPSNVKNYVTGYKNTAIPGLTTPGAWQTFMIGLSTALLFCYLELIITDPVQLQSLNLSWPTYFGGH